MKGARFLTIAVLTGLFMAVSCAELYKEDKFSLATYSPDVNAVFKSARRTEAVTITTKDGSVIYHKLFQKADPMPSYIADDIRYMTEYYAKNIMTCDKPVKPEDRKLLKQYKVPEGGLDDCVVLFLAQKAAKSYLNNDHKRLLLWYSASRLYQQYGRDKLYSAFLGGVNMQNRVWGVASAASYYFDRDLDLLNPSQKLWIMSAATLGHLPDKDSKAFEERTAMFASMLARKGFAEYRLYFQEPEYAKDKNINSAPMFSDIVLDEMGRRNIVINRDLRVTTGISLKTQQAVQAAIAERTKRLPEGIKTAVAVINMDSGTVEAMAATDRTRFRVMKMRRQIGSTFKPMVYLTAFKQGIRPTQLVNDKKYDYKNHGHPYSPSNYDNEYLGIIPVRKGLVYSLNNATIRVAVRAGLRNVAGTAKEMGMNYNIKPYLAMPLGIFPLTVLNVAKVYSVLGDYGVKQDISFIQSVRDENGDSVYYDRQEPIRIVPAENAYQVLYIMQDVARIGTARHAGLIRGTSAKTGTTNDSRDAWTVTVFYPYVAVAWVGYDGGKNMGEKDTGGGLAAPILAALQRRILPGVQKIDLKVPQGIVFKTVDSARGAVTGEGCLSLNTYKEAFAEGNVPDECVVSYLEPPDTQSEKKGQ